MLLHAWGVTHIEHPVREEVAVDLTGALLERSAFHAERLPHLQAPPSRVLQIHSTVLQTQKYSPAAMRGFVAGVSIVQAHIDNLAAVGLH